MANGDYEPHFMAHLAKMNNPARFELLIHKLVRKLLQRTIGSEINDFTFRSILDT